MTTTVIESSRDVRVARDRWVARGVATTPLVIARASGARIDDAEGKSYIDFAGGIGCQNVGHNDPSVVRALADQTQRFLHQCFIVGLYAPYVEVCQRLGELSPCEGAEQRSVLLGSGAEAVENAVKIARVATGRSGVLVFDRGFHGRTLLTMTMTAKASYKRGFGPFAPEVYRVPAPYSYRGVTEADALARLALFLATEVDPETIACAVIEPVQGEGGIIPMPPTFLRELKSVCGLHGILLVADEVQSGVGRTGPVWAVEASGVRPDLVVSGKSLGGGLPLAAVTGPAALVDAVPPGGLGGTFSGHPLSCVAATAILDLVATDAFAERANRVGTIARGYLEELTDEIEAIGEVRGQGSMLGIELVKDRESRDPADGLTQASVRLALDKGLVVVPCGIHGNVIRILPPLSINDADLLGGLEILAEAIVEARA